MNPKRFVSPVIILVTVTLLGLYFVYTVNSFRVLAKAEESLAKEHGRTASFAYQIVMSKYAYSPAATISRLRLAFSIPDSIGLLSELEFGAQGILHLVPRSDDWMPGRVDHYSWLAFLWTLLCALYYLDIFGTRTRSLGRNRRISLTVMSLLSLSGMMIWALLASGSTLLPGLHEKLVHIGFLETRSIALVNSVWAAWATCLWLLATFSAFSGERVIQLPPPADEVLTDGSNESVTEIKAPLRASRSGKFNESIRRPIVLIIAVAGIIIAVFSVILLGGKEQISLDSGIWNAGNWWLVRARRQAQVSMLDEMAHFDFVFLREIVDSTRTGNEVIVTLRESGGISKPVSRILRIQKDCIYEANRNPPVFCVSGRSTTTQIGHQSEEVWQYGSDSEHLTLFSPDLGILKETTIDKHGRLRSSIVTGYQVADQTGGRQRTSPPTCDWDGRQTRSVKLRKKNDPGRLDRSLARRNGLARKLSRMSQALSGTHGAVQVKVIFDRKRSIIKLLGPNSDWTSEVIQKTPKWIKTWLNPDGTGEWIVVYMESNDTVRIEVLNLASGSIKRNSYSMTKDAMGSSFGVHLMADQSACVLRLWRRNEERNLVADFKVDGSHLSRVRGSLSWY